MIAVVSIEGTIAPGHSRNLPLPIPLLGGSQAVHSWHHLGMWGIVTFVILHVYAALREDIMSRQTMISTMISGQRSFRE